LIRLQPSVEQARQHPRITLAVLSLGVIAFTLSQTTVAPALPHIQSSLGISESAVTWTLTAYLVSASVMTPIIGRLGDMFGKKRLLMVTLAAFAVGSTLCAVAPSIGVLIAGRVIQGAAGGLFPLAFAIVRDELPRDKVASSIGIVSAITGIGGGVGLVLGGVIVDHASWHWIFWVSLAITLVALAATYSLVPESPITTPGRVDWGGAGLLAVGLASPLIGVSQSIHWGWGDPRTIALVALGVPFLAGLVAYEKRQSQPLLDMATLARRPVLATNAATMFIGFAMFGSFVLIPQIAQIPESTGYGLGHSAAVAGLLLLPSTLVMLVVAPLSGRIGARRGSRGPLIAGALITGLALAFLAVAHLTPLELIVGALLMGTGVGFAFAAMPNLIIEAVRQEQTGEATAVNALVRNVGAAVGAQVSGTILAGSVVAGSELPAESGFTTAFAVAAGVAVTGAGLAVLVPARRRAAGDRSSTPVTLAGETDPAKA
jgi:EmrB/QacA subfamily drug resistance transporter